MQPHNTAILSLISRLQYIESLKGISDNNFFLKLPTQTRVLLQTIFQTNVLFSAYHDWLLSETVDILPHLLLPLAGPEELDEEEMEKLPPDLQYLGEEKERESDPVIRRMLLESLLQVVS